MQNTLVILVVGLSPALVGEHTPNLLKLSRRGGLRPMKAVTPAVTCTAQSSLVTGLAPSQHGIVANGWYFRDLSEVWLWRQSNKLVNGEKIWDRGKQLDSDFTCAKMFWWYNMYATADWSATPRPMYPADGRKIPDHYTYPAELHDELDAKFGQFPLFKFWGPAADITSSKWIADATCHVMQTRNPTLTLTYLPHLDYNLQRLGPDLNHADIQRDLREVDELCGQLMEVADAQKQHIMVVSEYGITPVTDAIHINRALREAGLLRVRVEKDYEQIDAGASDAFAVSDHQLAHVYINNPDSFEKTRAILSKLDGVEHILDDSGKAQWGLDHERAGDLVAISKGDRWFSYYYWLDDDRAPDYARTVDIHRKPGYDPVELFVDPAIKLPMLAIGSRLARKKLGFRTLLDVISLKDTQLVRGSHGRPTDDPQHGPILISSTDEYLPEGEADTLQFKELVLQHVFGR